MCLFSCNGKVTNNDNNIVQKNFLNLESEINFLDKKYFTGYRLNLDGSSVSDHPIFSYLNCYKEGYFAVHFIPKKDSLQFFWKELYFQKYKYEYDDLKTENKIISKILSNNFKDYIIFCYHIQKKYLISNLESGCSEESVFCKPRSKVIIYFYNQITKKWSKVKQLESEVLPPYVEISYFTKNFPKLFVAKESNNSNTENIDGSYFIRTKVESVETAEPIYIKFFLYIQKDKAILSIGTDNSMEAFCEGNYSIIKNTNENIKLKYIGEGICTSDKEESSFYIKKENNQYYIKSKRFLSQGWCKLEKKN